ncbi:Cytidine deaminase [Candidatus Syntrophocurvum alkaliphilum]|uniref:Cytidine deaminase n=1 Tax=Candidatus Syntrophocurvum alkaliphilum TaxID=2293317 RepID=A0A6I6DGH3_9FIRM|nr:cytidine deaminase [Candidatus Syntrophocurvum alkaliphilum]QGT99982.1 Cytidine deaminase [Candidatus Syntrophocurvum alkaliphilum]
MDHKQRLIKEALTQRLNAYAPYSGFKVGAALLTSKGEIYTGANVENSSYGLTVCAERIAIFKAVTEGETEFMAIGIAGSGEGYTFPCGACLQVIAEFAKDINIIVVDDSNNIVEYALKDMLPQAFSLQK